MNYKIKFHYHDEEGNPIRTEDEKEYVFRVIINGSGHSILEALQSAVRNLQDEVECLDGDVRVFEHSLVEVDNAPAMLPKEIKE